MILRSPQKEHAFGDFFHRGIALQEFVLADAAVRNGMFHFKASFLCSTLTKQQRYDKINRSLFYGKTAKDKENIL